MWKAFSIGSKEGDDKKNWLPHCLPLPPDTLSCSRFNNMYLDDLRSCTSQHMYKWSKSENQVGRLAFLHFYLYAEVQYTGTKKTRKRRTYPESSKLFFILLLEQSAIEILVCRRDIGKVKPILMRKITTHYETSQTY